jgi:hypothetical protein
MAKKSENPCANGCNHDGRHAVGWGPGGRNEWCANAGRCLDVFLKNPALRNAEQSHCPKNCSSFVDERTLVRQ